MLSYHERVNIITIYKETNVLFGVSTYIYMKNLIYHFPTCYTCHLFSVKKPIGEQNLKRALDEDTVFSFFFSFLPHWVRQLFLGIPCTLHQ